MATSTKKQGIDTGAKVTGLDGYDIEAELIKNMKGYRAKYDKALEQGVELNITATENERAKAIRKELEKRYQEALTDDSKKFSAATYAKHIARLRVAVCHNFIHHKGAKFFEEAKAFKNIQRNKYKAMLLEADISTLDAYETYMKKTIAKLKAIAEADPSEEFGARGTRVAIAWLVSLRDKLEPAILKHMVQPEHIKNTVARNATQRLKSYSSGDADTLYNAEEVLETMQPLLNLGEHDNAFVPVVFDQETMAYKSKSNTYNYTNGWQALATAIMLATGRRSYEVIYLTQFKALSKNKLQLTGVAKKRQEQKEKSFTIHTFWNAYEIAKAWKYLRSTGAVQTIKKNLDQLPAYERSRTFNSRFSGELGTAARSVLSKGLYDNDNEKVWAKPKDLRDLFVMISFDIYRLDKPKAKLTDFIQTNLLHDNAATSTQYEKFSPINSVDLATVEKLKLWTFEKQSKSSVVADLTLLLEHSDIKPSKALKAITEKVIERLKSDKEFKVTSYTLQNFYGKDQKKRGLASPVTITKWLRIVRSQSIEL